MGGKTQSTERANERDVESTPQRESQIKRWKDKKISKIFFPSRFCLFSPPPHLQVDEVVTNGIWYVFFTGRTTFHWCYSPYFPNENCFFFWAHTQTSWGGRLMGTFFSTFSKCSGDCVLLLFGESNNCSRWRLQILCSLNETCTRRDYCVPFARLLYALSLGWEFELLRSKLTFFWVDEV